MTAVNFLPRLVCLLLLLLQSSKKKSKRGGRARGRGEMMRVNALFGGKGKAETSKDTSTSKSPATKDFHRG